MLTRKLALAYARDGFPVIKVDLKALAQAMEQAGTFPEKLMAVGLGDVGVAPEAIEPAFLASGVLLCDGLDEVGDAQDLIALHLAAFAERYPGCRVVVTTRPIGYETPHLAGWRHYEIAALDSHSAGDRVGTLLMALLPDKPAERRAIRSFVEQQLEGNRDGGSMTHSPLLLGLCAMLGFHRAPFGSSRNELYERVFGWIEQSSAIPHSSSLTTRCVDVLGWVLTIDPNAKLGRVRARCADILAAESGKPRLAAEKDFEQCIAFWQRAGMIERVRHAGNDMLLFVHKTFGEYAGARYLAGLPDDAARDALIREQAQRASSMELLRFAGGLGLAEPIVGALLTPMDSGAPHGMKIRFGAEILADGAGRLPARLIGEILDAAFALVCVSPVAAGFIAPTLVHAAKHYPDEIAARAGPLQDDSRNWTRLAAWACLAAAGPSHYDLDALVSTFLDLPDLGMHAEDFGPRPDTGDRDAVQELAVAFASLAFEEMLKQLPPDRSNALLAALLPRIGAGDALPPIGFMRRATALLRSAGRGADARCLFSRWSGSSVDELERDAKDYEQVLTVVLDRLVDVTNGEPADRHEKDAHGPYMHLGAFLEATGYGFVNNRDIADWRRPYDAEAENAVVGALVALSGVDAAALHKDALDLRADIETRPEEALARGLWFWRGADIPDLDYSGARRLDLPPRLTNRARRHPSAWIADAAAKLHDAIGR